MQTLKLSDLIALGFMTFALFLGAGNIIFPPLVGLLAGDDMGPAALGFLLTGVGLPLLTIVALARVGGGIAALTAPVGRVAGTTFGVLVYLAIGPFFASPRTATVSFEIGFSRFFDPGTGPLLMYSVIYFAVVMLIALYPNRLIDNVGKFITPVLIAALVLLGAAALYAPAGEIGDSQGAYQSAPLVQGFLHGYQTMDALGALVFGIVIVNAIRGRNVTDTRLQTYYAIWAAIIAAIGLALVYVSLIYLGATSAGLHPDATTGVPVLAGFTQQTFGQFGSVVLAVVIVCACLTTAVGLITACGEYFSALLGVSYRKVVIVFCVCSMGVANLGLTQLIAVSVPVLVGMYPVAITLVLLSLMGRFWRSAPRVFVPALAVATVFGVADGLNAAGFGAWVPGWVNALPAASLGLAWLVPVFVAVAAGVVFDRLLPAP